MSGLAQDPDSVERAQVDAVFPVGEQADFRALLDYVEQTGAKTVYLVGGLVGGVHEEILRALGARAVKSRPLGDPEQLRLFGV